MQSVMTATVPLGATQEPLLTEQQIQVGRYVTGIDYTFLWEIVGIDSAEHTALLRKVSAAPVAPSHEHTFIAMGRGLCCTCGMRKEPIKELLPLKAGKPRAHLLVPQGPLEQPREGVVYGALVGNALVTVTAQGKQWSIALPAVPALVPLWEPPVALTAILETDLSAVVDDESPTTDF